MIWFCLYKLQFQRPSKNSEVLEEAQITDLYVHRWWSLNAQEADLAVKKEHLIRIVCSTWF